MKRLWLPLLLGIAAGTLRMSFFAALPQPFSAPDAVILLVLWYVAAQEPAHAFAAAVAAGAAADGLSSLPFGSHAAAYAAGSAVAILLFTRVFTSHDWPGLLGTSLAAFVTTHAALAALRAIDAMVGGLPAMHAAFGGATATSLASALFAQFAATCLALIAAAPLHRRYLR